MAEDLRHRYAAAILARLAQTTGPTPSDYDLADAVMAVRDEDLERLQERAAYFQGRFQHAAENGDDLALQLIGMDSEVREVTARAEKAEAANCLVRERLDALIAAGFGAVTDTLRELRAALDDTEGTDRG